MPTSKSAEKRLRQTKKRTERNVEKKRQLDYLLRQAKKYITANDRNKAWEFMYKYQKAVDKAAKTFLHKNTAARRKSRLMAKFNTLR